MKTTVDIPNSLFQEIKRFSNRKGLTLKEVLLAALRVFLQAEKSSVATPFKLRKHSFKGQGLVEGLQEGNWSEIRRRIYEGQGG